MTQNKRVICISGNCVTGVMPDFLKTCQKFNDNYVINILQPVHLVQSEQQIEDFLKAIKNCDVFFTQPVGGEKYIKRGIDTASIKSILKPDTQIFTMPVPYFTGYFPEQFYLHDENGNVGYCEGLPSPYHNKFILYGYVNKRSPQEILDLLYSENINQNVEQIAQQSINELQNREKELNFTISDFIAENYKKQRLFYTLNHPTKFLLFYMAKKIMSVLALYDNCEYDIECVQKDFLNSYITPILPSVQKRLNLEITSEWNNTKYTLDFIKITYDYYDRHPELVKFNESVIDGIL